MPITLNLDALVAAVNENDTLDASAVTLIEGIAAKISEAVAAALAADDAADQGSVDAAQAAIDATVAQLVASNQKLATALVANTPSE